MMTNSHDTKEELRASLEIDGISIPLNTFAEKVFRNTILGMVSSLKGIDENPQRITLTVSRKGIKDE